MNAAAKTITVLVGITVAAFAGNGLLNHLQANTNAKIEKLQNDLTESKRREAQHEAERKHLEEKAKQADARSEEWKAQAQAALARVGRLEGRMREIEAQIATLGDVHPATDPKTLTPGATAVATRMTTEGITAEPVGNTVVLQEPVALEALAFIIDGKEYPKVLERTGLLQEQVDNLKGQKAGLIVAVENQTKATEEAQAAYRTQVAATAEAVGERDEAKAQVGIKDGIIKEKDALLRAEAKKKWFWGGGGIGIALLVLLL